jgi:hypothetical protein
MMAAKKPVSPAILWTMSIVFAVLFGSYGLVLVFNPFGQSAPSSHLGEGSELYRLLVGAPLCVGAILLVLPRMAWIGATLLALTCAVEAGRNIYIGHAAAALIPALFIISLATLAWVRRPGSTSM